MKASMNRLHWLFVCALWTATSARAQALTPAAALSHVAEVGAKQAVLDYYQTSQWDHLVRCIASGDRDWLAGLGMLVLMDCWIHRER